MKTFSLPLPACTAGTHRTAHKPRSRSALGISPRHRFITARLYHPKDRRFTSGLVGRDETCALRPWTKDDIMDDANKPDFRSFSQRGPQSGRRISWRFGWEMAFFILTDG